MNDETYSEYLLGPTDDLIRFWRSKVKVIDGEFEFYEFCHF